MILMSMHPIQVWNPRRTISTTDLTTFCLLLAATGDTPHRRGTTCALVARTHKHTAFHARRYCQPVFLYSSH